MSTTAISIKPTEYFIHDNCNRPFRVTIDRNQDQIKIYKKDEPNHFLSYNPKKVFIGKSTQNKMTKFSGGYGSQFDGNSILLQMDQTNYIFIGYQIFSFQTSHPIVSYVSQVGNNDVPYPYAVDMAENYYLLIEDVILKKIPKLYQKDPYNYYYDHFLITADEGRRPIKCPIIKTDIVKFYIGIRKYTLTYNPHPTNYKRFTNSKKKKCKLFVVKTDKKKYELTKEMYIDLMHQFGEKAGFEPLHKKIIQERL